MGMRELLACAIALGAAGGYAWTALPEPSSLALLAVTAGAALRRRRRC